MAEQMQKKVIVTRAKWSQLIKQRSAAWPALLEEIEKFTAEKNRRDWESGGQVAAAVQKFPLGRDNVGELVEMISIDVGGQKHQYRTTRLPPIDAQSTGLATEVHTATTSDILDRLERDGVTAPPRMICDAETLRVSGPERERLSSLLWNYISAHRDDTQSDVLTAVGSAIRKYIAMLDVSRMNEVASLLEAGHRAPLSLELELEVVKMIYRKFEANPPAHTNTEAALSARLWEMAQDYMRPRFILREKYATVASLAVEAIVASRGSEAGDAVAAALSSPFAWFREMVTDDLVRLADRWRQKRPEAADWCEAIVRDVHPILGGEAHAGSAHH